MQHIIGIEYVVKVHSPIYLNKERREKVVVALKRYMEKLETENGNDWVELNEIQSSTAAFKLSLLRPKELHWEEVQGIREIIRQTLRSEEHLEQGKTVSVDVYQPSSNVSAFC